MSKPWFEADTGALLLDRYVVDMPSFQSVIADRVISEAELAEQAERVVTLLRELEAKLDPSTRDLATETLCELAVLNALHVRHLSSST